MPNSGPPGNRLPSAGAEAGSSDLRYQSHPEKAFSERMKNEKQENDKYSSWYYVFCLDPRNLCAIENSKGL